MENLSEIVEFFNHNDLFCVNNHIRITRIEPGHAWGELEAEYNSHANGGGVVQGGALYTLADFVFAAAACFSRLFASSARSLTFSAMLEILTLVR